MNLYCRTPFGRLDQRNPDIIELAKKLGRTPGSAAMKLNNLASLDPALKARSIRGLGNASRLDAQVWNEFHDNWEALAFESQQAVRKLGLGGDESEDDSAEPAARQGETEVERTVRARLVQSFFRRTVLASYEFKCSFCGLDLPPLLVASHIIPWRNSVERRADPRNGLSLCALHDKAFDKGLLGIGADYRILIAPVLKAKTPFGLLKTALIDFDGVSITLPRRFQPDPEAVLFHRTHIFGHT
jgi:putative restriction endonuclease